MRLLVVEDEPKLAQYLHKGLSEHGHVVDLAHDGIEGRRLATGGEYDLVLLDVMLPGIDGYGVLRAIRERSRALPVLMLTARDAVEDRVRGLEEGADDYLVKPFAFTELLARVAALLRRSGQGQEQALTQLSLADLELDLLARRVTRAGQRLELTAKEFNLLTLLLRRRGQILSRTTLAERVWGMNFDSDTNLVEVAVRRLRAKLDDPFPAKLLHTVRGMGYVLEERAE
ncbi:MAG: DNA-binding response regulator [Burkholderiales bacterium PBB6]|uniref:Heavy metal response regulator transcription factor n=1 Tax=Ideonella margarita TaxID=2984191 RepID=A0ABU9C4Y5_9BURK|nr:MAG: DNA-binding response regulator [Burkholderiales bacterium PBB6]